MRRFLLTLCLAAPTGALAQDATEPTADAATEADTSSPEATPEAEAAPEPEATPEPRSRTRVDTTGARSAGTATRVGALDVDPASIEPVTDDASRAAYDTAVASLTAGLDTAQRGLAEAERAESTARTEVKVARTNITTRNLEYKAAKNELKVQKKLGKGGETAAVRAAEDAKSGARAAKATLSLKQAEYKHAMAHTAHLEALIARLETTLVEVTLRGQAEPPADAEALLEVQKATSKAIGDEAKARDTLAKALLGVEKAKDKLAKVK